jgi:hypothetical protein
MLERKLNDQVIITLANQNVMDELIEYRDGIDRDPEDWPNGYTLFDALDDLVSRCESNGWKDCPRNMKQNLRDIEIALGTYVEVSDEELARTMCTGKKYSFIHNGKKYKFK